VFCEDGFNLTGYCIVSFLRQVFKMPLGIALQAFAEARPPGIFHAPYLDDLHALYGDAAAQTPPAAPDWAVEASRCLGTHTQALAQCLHSIKTQPPFKRTRMHRGTRTLTSLGARSLGTFWVGPCCN
jgi:hypothetical protein